VTTIYAKCPECGCLVAPNGYGDYVCDPCIPVHDSSEGKATE
jgi:hypothetical protein